MPPGCYELPVRERGNVSRAMRPQFGEIAFIRRKIRAAADAASKK
jgi:hypothetical protein